MKSKAFLLMLAAIFAMVLLRPAEARGDVSFSFFYDRLAPYGEWIEVGDYGNCWRPNGVDADWAPYSDGYWTYTDAGWTWVSYEDFGGIVYHYGRWVRVEDEGWCWKPDVEWAPAWVSWRHSNEHVGWAPLPPECHFRRETGVSVWVDNEYDIGPASYNFCRTEDFGAPVLRPVLVNRYENVKIINRSVNITNITYYNAGVYNGGPDYRVINQRVRRPIPALKLVRNTNVNVTNINNIRNINVNSVQRGNQLTVIAPNITAGTAEEQRARRPRIARVVPKEKVNRGWLAVNDPEDRRALREKYKEESKGLRPESAPAKPVQVADLDVVPTKADPNAKPAVGTLRPSKRDRQTAAAAEVPATPANNGAPVTRDPGNQPAPPTEKPVVANPVVGGKKQAAANGKGRPTTPEPASAAALETAPTDSTAVAPAVPGRTGKGRRVAKETPETSAPALGSDAVPAPKGRKGMAAEKPASPQVDPAVANAEAVGRQQEAQTKQELTAARENELADQQKKTAPKKKNGRTPGAEGDPAQAAAAAAAAAAAQAKQAQAAQAREQRMEVARQKQAEAQQHSEALKQQRMQESAAADARRQQAVEAKEKQQAERAATMENTRPKADRQKPNEAAQAAHAAQAAQAAEARRVQAQRNAAADNAREAQAENAARQQQAAQAANAQRERAARQQQLQQAASQQQAQQHAQQQAQRQAQAERASQGAQREQAARQQQIASQQQQAQRAAQAAQQRAVQPRPAPAAVAPRQAPPAAAAASHKGKGKLTPEEAAALQGR